MTVLSEAGVIASSCGAPGGETLVAVHNITAARLSFRLSGLGGDLNQPWADCLSGHVFEPHQSHSLSLMRCIGWFSHDRECRAGVVGGD